MSDRRVVPREVLHFKTSDGRDPFEEWLNGLKDMRAWARIEQRINRVRMGNFGVYASLGDDVYELKIDYGPGYRIYFGQDDGAVVLLLCGGDKSTQRADIKQAKAYWHIYRTRRHAELHEEA